MSIDRGKERYGLRRTQVSKSRRVGFDTRPLTEEDKAFNRARERVEKLAENYNRSVQELSNLLDDRVFVADSLGFIASRVTGKEVLSLRPILEYPITNDIPALTGDEEIQNIDEIKNIKTRIVDAKLTYSADVRTLQMLNGALLARNLKFRSDFPEPDTPEVLYRVFGDHCHGRHDRKLGFRSSRQPLTLPDGHACTLDACTSVDEEALRDQCERNRPSDLIALFDSPLRIFNLIQGWDFNDLRGASVAIINVAKLIAMGVLFNRTTTLAQSRNMPLWRQNQPNGLQFANPNYWVAYRWVPAECIDGYISISSLREACESHSIDSYNERLSLDQLLEQSSITGMQDLKLGQ